MKQFVCWIGGLLGAAVSYCFGGWSAAIAVLLILMAIDYITGLVVAGVFHASPKSTNGGLESKAGWKGLIRKVVTWMIVVVAHLIDQLLGANYLRDAVVIAFCLNEIISIIENAGLMGIPIPKALTKAIDVLQEKTKEQNEDDSMDKAAVVSFSYKKCGNATCECACCPFPLSEQSDCSGYVERSKNDTD